jgi:hypothetical protein
MDKQPAEGIFRLPNAVINSNLLRELGLPGFLASDQGDC